MNFAIGTTVVVMVGFIFALVLPGSKASVTPNCYECDNLYRYCPNGQQQCGSCLHGFEELDNSCHYIWNVTHNTNASIIAGNSVILTCLFEEPVDCNWAHQDAILDFNGHITYISGNGGNTLDCSILIRPFSKNDTGKWICASKGTSSSLAQVKSTKWLDIASTAHEAESLVPEIKAKLNYYNSLLKSTSTRDDQKEEDAWFQCSVKSVLPVNLYWTVNGNHMNATSKSQVEHKTTIFLNWHVGNENFKKTANVTMKCLAEYPNINQRFTDEVTLIFEHRISNHSGTPSINDSNDELLRTMFMLLCGLFFFGIFCVMAYAVFRLVRKIQKTRNTNSEKQKYSDIEKADANLNRESVEYSKDNDAEKERLTTSIKPS